MDDYSENTPLVMYGPIAGEDCNMAFYRVCPKCRRFVTPDDAAKMPEYSGNEPNATCKKCGRVQMDFCTWIYPTEDGEL